MYGHSVVAGCVNTASLAASQPDKAHPADALLAMPTTQEIITTSYRTPDDQQSNWQSGLQHEICGCQIMQPLKSDGNFHSSVCLIIEDNNRINISRPRTINQMVSCLTGRCTVERCRALRDERIDCPTPSKGINTPQVVLLLPPR